MPPLHGEHAKTITGRDAAIAEVSSAVVGWLSLQAMADARRGRVNRALAAAAAHGASMRELADASGKSEDEVRKCLAEDSRRPDGPRP